MVKRALAAVVWFIVVDSAFNVLSLFLGTPSILGLVVAGGLSAIIVIDPVHLLVDERNVEATPSPAAVNPVQRPVSHTS